MGKWKRAPKLEVLRVKLTRYEQRQGGKNRSVFSWLTITRRDRLGGKRRGAQKRHGSGGGSGSLFHTATVTNVIEEGGSRWRMAGRRETYQGAPARGGGDAALEKFQSAEPVHPRTGGTAQ